MSDIDVSADIDILADPTDVAAVMFDPSREPEWVKAVSAVEVLDPALVPGARVRHSGSVFGRDFSWTTRVESAHFPHLLTLRIEDGPFTGTIRYDVQRSGAGTRARIRSVGQLNGLDFLPVSMIAGPIRSALASGLERLKGLVEK